MEPKKSNLINMDISDLEKLSKPVLIKLIFKTDERKPMDYEPITKPITKPINKPKRLIPTLLKSVNSLLLKSVNYLVKKFEDNIITPITKKISQTPIPASIPPPQLKADYKPIPPPRTKKILRKMLQDSIPQPQLKDDYKPISLPITEKKNIKKKNNRKKNYNFTSRKSFERLYQIIRCGSER